MVHASCLTRRSKHRHGPKCNAINILPLKKPSGTEVVTELNVSKRLPYHHCPPDHLCSHTDFELFAAIKIWLVDVDDSHTNPCFHRETARRSASNTLVLQGP